MHSRSAPAPFLEDRLDVLAPSHDSQSRPRRGSADDRGSVTVEYAVLLCLVALVGSFALVAAGVPLVRMFAMRETWLLLPFP